MTVSPESMTSRIIESYYWTIKIIMAALLAAMVVLVFGNVVLRYLFNSGIAVSEEVSRWLFVWMVFLGAIVGLREHAHLGVDTLVKMLPPLGRKVCFVVSHGLMLYAAALLSEGAWKQTLLNWDTIAPASGLPVGLFYASGLVFGVAAIPMLLHDLYLLVTGQLANADLIAVSESEDHPNAAIKASESERR